MPRPPMRVVDHELGHQLDALLDLENNVELKDIHAELVNRNGGKAWQESQAPVPVIGVDEEVRLRWQDPLSFTPEAPPHYLAAAHAVLPRLIIYGWRPVTRGWTRTNIHGARLSAGRRPLTHRGTPHHGLP